MGKLTDDTLKWTLDVNGKPAMKELNDLEQSTRKLEQTNKDLRVEMQKLEAHGKKNGKEYKALNEQLKKNNRTITASKTKMADLRKQVGLTALTSRQLRSEYKRLKNQMDNTTPNTKEWKRLDGELTAVKNRMNQLRGTGARTNKMFGAFKELLPALGIGLVISQVAKLGKELLGLSIRLEGENRRAAIVFGDSLKYVTQEAETLSKKMGLTNKEFVASAAATADLLIPLDFARDKAAKMSVKLQSLAGALDEWTGGQYGAAEVSRILTKAMLGENEQLKQLGIAIRMDSEEFKTLVKQKLAAGAATKAQAQAEATLDLIYKKSADAQTAYTQSGNKLLRMQKSITRWWRQLKESVVLYFNESAADKIKAEREQVNLLAIEITNTNIPAEKRNKLYEQLKQLAPDVVEGIDKENIAVDTLRKNLEKYNQEIIKKLALQDSEETLSAKREEYAKKISERVKNETNLTKELFKIKEFVSKIDKEKAENISKILYSSDDLLTKEKKILEITDKIDAHKFNSVNYLHDEMVYRNRIIKNKEEELQLQQDFNIALQDYTKMYDSIMGKQKKTTIDPKKQEIITIKKLRTELKKLKDQYENIDTSDTKLLEANKKQQRELQATIDKLEHLFDELDNVRAKYGSITEMSAKGIGDVILSDEDAAKVISNMQMVDTALDALGKDIENKPGKLEGLGGYIGEALFGKDWTSKSLIDKIQAIGQFTINTLNDINKIISNAEQQQLMNFEANTSKKKELLNKQLNDGKISYEEYTARTAQLDADLDKKRRKIAHDEAVRSKALAIMQTVLNTAAGVARAFKDYAFPYSAIIAGIVGALGGVQIGIAASQPVPAYASGNYADLIGASDGKKYRAKVINSNHPSGLFSEPTYVPGFGMFGETQTPELVFNPTETQRIMNSPLLIDAINTTLGRTNQFATGNSTEIIRESATIEKTFTDPAMLALMQKINDKLDEPAQAVLVANEDYIRTHQEVTDEYNSFRERVG